MTLKYQGATNEEIARACMAEKIRQLEREVAGARADHRLILDRYELLRGQKEKLEQEAQVLRTEVARLKLGREHHPRERSAEPVTPSPIPDPGIYEKNPFSLVRIGSPPKDDDSICGEPAVTDPGVMF